MVKQAWLVISLLVLGAQTAVAQQRDEFDDRWYLGGSVGGLLSGGDSGAIGAVNFGKSITPYFGIELEGTYGSLAASGQDQPLFDGSDYERFTGGFNVMGFFARDTATIRPYVIAGGAYHSIDFLTENLSGASFSIGAGAMLKLAQAWDARLQVRHNTDFISGQGVVVDDTFNLVSTELGVRYKFGADPYDDDGDGVPNDRDKCPNTPKGVAVDANGCPFDGDGDGVPDYLDQCPNTAPGMVVGANGCELDSDGDGVPDFRDQCPNTPRGVPVGANGCPLDSDGDGVPDYLDKCAGTPRGVKVGADGCSLADQDNDGIPDELDKCPGTPPGIPVGPDGCPLDSDGDGIPDYLDECPNSPPGAKVLPNGCALVGDCRKPKPGEKVDANGCALNNAFILRGVNFEFDSDRLTPEAKLILNEVSETLKAYPGLAIEVEGHTDNIGTDAYNLGLSERRAIAVRTYLGGRGVDTGPLTPVGYGESQPIDTNDTEQGRAENRRVVLNVKE